MHLVFIKEGMWWWFWLLMTIISYLPNLTNIHTRCRGPPILRQHSFLTAPKSVGGKFSWKLIKKEYVLNKNVVSNKNVGGISFVDSRLLIQLSNFW